MPTVLDTFQPGPVLRNAHVQSLIVGLRLRRALLYARAARGLLGASREYLLNCGDGVRLQGFHSAQPADRSPRGLVILLHGWEGSADSAYVVSTGERLYRAGYEVFRLNFRDHGDTHHLNVGIFHSNRIEEVAGALREIARRFGARPLLLAGFSLGGNFALRLGLRAPGMGIPLSRIVAVNAVVDPANSLVAMDEGLFIYRHYFIKKWRRSLRRKQACYPDRYDFSDWFRLESLGAMTDYLARHHAGYSGAQEYFDGYSIAGDRLRELRIPATVITAQDDPIIPVSDYRELVCPDALTLKVTRYGGHCGYFYGPALRSWAEEQIFTELSRVAPDKARPALVA